MTSVTRFPAASSQALSFTRRVGDVDIPASGRWWVAARRTLISFSARRLWRRAQATTGRAKEAAILAGEHPDDIAVTVRLDAPGRPTIVLTSGWPVPLPVPLRPATVPGLRAWPLSGDFSVGRLALPVEANLEFHGIWDDGDKAYGSFVLSGSIDHGTRAQRRVRFSVELLADGPAAASPERGAA
jgi:hypothetical protein